MFRLKLLFVLWNHTRTNTRMPLSRQRTEQAQTLFTKSIPKIGAFFRSYIIYNDNQLECRIMHAKAHFDNKTNYTEVNNIQIWIIGRLTLRSKRHYPH